MAKALAAQLSQLGIECYLTRTDDTFIQLSDRVAASKGADCFVSLHNNAVASPEVSGVLTLYGAPGGKSKALANYVHQALVKALPGHKDHGMRASPSPGYDRRLYVLAAAIVPAVLVEPEFLSSRQWGPWLATADAHKTVAYAVATGVLQFFKSLPGAVYEDLVPPPAVLTAEQAATLLEAPPRAEAEAVTEPNPEPSEIPEQVQEAAGQGRRLTAETTPVRGGPSRNNRKRR